jgi:hypothetical protein
VITFPGLQPPGRRHLPTYKKSAGKSALRLPLHCLKVLGLSFALACSRGATPASTPTPAEAQKPANTHGLAVAPLAGQAVAVLPITMVLADSAVESDSAYAPYRDRRSALHRTDSLIAETLEGRGPEVHWVLPPELRKMARRAPGMLSDPDQMGQAMMRAPQLTRLPDPLRSSLRTLVAIAGGRMVFIPAALGFGRDTSGQVHATLSLVLADARNGTVMWRSVAVGAGASPDAALNAALATIFPTE